ncbi:unnamed protein product [Soboliphyme baturini]|uniref:Octanoyl-[acyl-carrier-protein]:protein N-octanoyltransferase LIPT2, mitochondrial n=1 Tax=Soboliphyme baturini TaxID=241478 RepID=A0A183IFY4_9BILA|nr:unnamed protein product [Soboliphyme baturini]
MTLPRHVVVKWCGLMTYSSALQLQQKFVELLLSKKRQQNGAKDVTLPVHNTVLMLEHSPVYTIGVRTAHYDELEEKRLRSLGADFRRTDRGGLITFHGPGQLVVYPILALSDFRSSCAVKWYVTKLEQCLIDVCGRLGLNAYAPGVPYTGVWEIVPCGLVGKKATSLSNQLHRTVTVTDAIVPFVTAFAEHFNCIAVCDSKI